MRTTLKDIAGERFDALIIGAGINGAGIARDAALRGLRVLLVDKDDIGGGTTAWSSRLIHGGLRYLEHGEIGLVRESLRERERLLRIASHLVKPLPMLIPLYRNGARSPLLIRAGMIAYDLLSFDKSLPRHRMLSSAQALRRVPGLNQEGLRGAALYYDAQVEYAERLAVENALDARALGARILTHTRVEGFIIEDDEVLGARLTDSSGEDAFEVRAAVTLNVAGPWVDQVLSETGGAFAPFIGGTKGSHIVIEKFTGAPPPALYVEAQADGRPFFILPWNDKYLIGTTDTRYLGDLDCVEASEAEIDYLIRETNRVIPLAQLTRADVLYTYAGVRPLPYAGTDKAASGITRRHFVRDHAPHLGGLVSVIGGKLTTYRNLSEQTVNLLFKKLKRNAPPCTTGERRLPGAATDDWDAFSAELRSGSDKPDALIARLLKIYGTRARSVLKLAETEAGLKTVFDEETGAIAAEVVFAFEHEMAATLCDCLLRRTMVGMNSSAGIVADTRAALIAQHYLGWTHARAAQETEDYRQYIKRFHPASLTSAQPSQAESA